jgi:hypothetical protein
VSNFFRRFDKIVDERCMLRTDPLGPASRVKRCREQHEHHFIDCALIVFSDSAPDCSGLVGNF